MEKSICALINDGTKILQGLPAARLDAEIILGKIIGKNKLYLLTNKQEKISEHICDEYFKLVNLRKNKMPVKYIIKECEFYGLNFYVEEGVLIPRNDTEVLVEHVIDIINSNKCNSIDHKINLCDLCSGSGIIGISIAKNIENIYADEIDFYDIPEKVTKINIEKNDLAKRVNFIKSDLLNEVIGKKEYDVIVSNPPYIKKEEIDTLMSDVKDYEPESALDGGIDGLDFYRRIVLDSTKVLKKSGLLAFEIGYDEAYDVKEIMKKNGYIKIKIIKDLAGLDRVVLGFLK